MTTQAQTAGPLNSAVLGIAAIGFLVTGAAVLYALMGQGHAAFNTSDDGMFWGLPIVVYDFFLLTSTGLALTATFGLVMGLSDFNAIAKRCLWLALAGLIGGVAALSLELSYPLRALYAIPLSFQTASPFFWKVLFVAAYVILLLALIAKVNRPDWTVRSTRGLAIAVLVAALGISMIAGSVYGMMAMRPFWYDGLIPFYFLATAALSGVAFAVLASYLAHGFSQAAMPGALRELMQGAMPKLFAALLGLNLLLLAARSLTGVWSNYDGMQAFEWMVASPWFWVEIAAYVLAFFILLSPNLRSQGNMQLAASVLVILALFIGRYEYVIGGQVVPLFKGAWVPDLIAYTPSLTEWMLALLALSLTFGIYALGEKMLNLSAAPDERS